MIVDFERGYKYVLDNVGGAIGADISQMWLANNVDRIDYTETIKSMTEQMISACR